MRIAQSLALGFLLLVLSLSDRAAGSAAGQSRPATSAAVRSITIDD
jgi:hypothetical protein